LLYNQRISAPARKDPEVIMVTLLTLWLPIVLSALAVFGWLWPR
jgi:hypothetical protein